MITPAIERCHKALLRAGYSRAEFLMPHASIKEGYTETNAIPTMGISADGKIAINAKYSNGLPMDQLGGVVCHEICHFVLEHSWRCGTRDRRLWNVATDMTINTALRADGLALPTGALFPPAEYTGEVRAEPIYDWLHQKEQEGNAGDWPQPGDEPGATEGCGPTAPEGEGAEEEQGDASGATPGESGQPVNPAELRRQMVALAKVAGRGSSAVAGLLAPEPSRVDWRRILSRACDVALSCPGRDLLTYSRRSRRSPIVGAQLPGVRGKEPSIAVAIDVSGSMDREWLGQIIGHCAKLGKGRQVRIFIVAHTDRVVFSGWARGEQDALSQAQKACEFSGGTDPRPAYDLVGATRAPTGRFSTLVHFTDCEFGSAWPTVPARRLIVGHYGHGSPYCPPPAGSELVPCMREGES